MCPRNITVSSVDAQLEGGVDLESDNTTEFAFLIDVFSSSLEPVHYSIAVEVVPHFNIT